ncbi:MAG: exodeoxyribonuclease VII large subunit [Oscillospiraceae bacterium]|jgi:exodeoxyribonuclease VII large subunit|nr:exodeoxyribonuclease VII large subunit [Oscillospiraceae bacterium]
MEERILSVSELNAYVQRSLASDPMLQNTRMRGEISNFKAHSSGHLYFSLKDESARIQCVMFRQNAMMCPLRMSDGLRVVVSGRAALYPRDGTYQFYIETASMDGVGALFLRYEQLRKKLLAEGLFDASLKKPLPLLPRGVGIVTSPTGAVIRDIQTVAKRRHPGVPLYLVPTKVQGEGAENEIAAAIRFLDKFDKVDVIIIGRGGGSLEDLWPFNEEVVARAIHASATPIISAVGHETDTALSDFAADVRAPTPSAAAELAVPILYDLALEITSREIRLDMASSAILKGRLETLKFVSHRLMRLSPYNTIKTNRANLASFSERLERLALELVKKKKLERDNLVKRIVPLNPNNVVNRGYAIVSANARTISATSELLLGDSEISVRLRDGVIKADVTNILKGN